MWYLYHRLRRQCKTLGLMHPGSTLNSEQWLLGSFTGTVASYKIPEASIGMLKLDGNQCAMYGTIKRNSICMLH